MPEGHPDMPSQSSGAVHELLTQRDDAHCSFVAQSSPSPSVPLNGAVHSSHCSCIAAHCATPPPATKAFWHFASFSSSTTTPGICSHASQLGCRFGFNTCQSDCRFSR